MADDSGQDKTRAARRGQDSGCLPGCLMVVGFLLCLTGFGLIIGVPLIVAGYLAPFASQAIEKKIRQSTEMPHEDDEDGDEPPDSED